MLSRLHFSGTREKSCDHPNVSNASTVATTEIVFTFQIGQYALFFFMPQAVRSLSGVNSNAVAGILVMVPYLAGLLAMIAVSRSSDRRLERRYHVAIPGVVGGLF